MERNRVIVANGCLSARVYERISKANKQSRRFSIHYNQILLGCLQAFGHFRITPSEAQEVERGAADGDNTFWREK